MSELDNLDDMSELGDDCGECDCGAIIDHATVHVVECSKCGWVGCSRCICDGGDDIYPDLCEDCQ